MPVNARIAWKSRAPVSRIVSWRLRRLTELSAAYQIADEIVTTKGFRISLVFAPSVTVGLLRRADLAGYRNAPVYIRHSMYVSPNSQAVRDAIGVFEMLTQETELSVRVVSDHLIFVQIHPYIEGNGQVGRFLMNVMLAAGGYPWIVISLERRDAYMAALEEASVRQNIAPFTDFLESL